MVDNTARCIRVLLVDDHPVTREGVRRVLEPAPDISVVGEASTGAEARALVADLRPDILLLDLVLPDCRPFEVEFWVRERYPEITTLILTAHDLNCYLSQGVQAGVAGYLVKDLPAHQLVAAIQRAAHHESLLTAEQYARARQWQAEVGDKYEALTDQEREVLKLLAQGLDNTAIAERLEISSNTVRSHCSRIYKKLEVPDRVAALMFAQRLMTECP